MKIVIIEDEKLTAADLAETITDLVPEARIIALLYSVRSAITWFNENENPDLIFSDVQLGDGLCFEIFKSVAITAPVIFCTAYDEYALKAFRTNGIDYILKPFDTTSVKTAIDKYNKLKNTFTGNQDGLFEIIRMFEKKRKSAQGSVLVYKQDKIMPVRFDDIALFYIENEVSRLLTFDRKEFIINKTLEKIEEIAPDDFYRVNRQFLVNRNAIREASQYFARKLSLSLTLPFDGTITVSKNKVSDFLDWLSGR